MHDILGPPPKCPLLVCISLSLAVWCVRFSYIRLCLVLALDNDGWNRPNTTRGAGLIKHGIDLMSKELPNTFP